MAKKKSKGKPIVTSRDRAQARLWEEESRKIREIAENKTPNNLNSKEDQSIILVEGEEAEVATLTLEEMINQLREKSVKAHEDAVKLPKNVYKLFELTRDGKETPEDYRKELISSREVSGDDIYHAIELGFEAIPHTFFSKER